MIKSAAHIRAFLANELPMYTNDAAEDDFLIMARADDIERIALELWRKIAESVVECDECRLPKIRVCINGACPNQYE